MRFLKCIHWLVLAPILMLATHGFAQTNLLPRISALEATNYLNQRVIVVDEVVQVAMRSNIWLLHLNQKYPKSPLNAVIRREATNNFSNINVYRGQQVEITGVITQGHGRLELAMTSPDQIKILSATATSPKPATVTAPVAAAMQPEPVASAPAKEAVASASPALAAVPVTQPVPKTGDDSGRTLNWILGLLGVISVLVAVGVFSLWRRPAGDVRMVPAASAMAKSAGKTPSDPSSTDEWKQRALAAEAMAGKQGQILREKMIPELTEFAKQSLVQGLYAQRNALIETQRKAQEAVAELEARLTTLQAPLKERISAYEKRIAELEQEVESQGEEMRELARATLTLVRRKLEDERLNAGGQFQSQSRFN